MTGTEGKRNTLIDILRVVGTLLVILAHMGIPDNLANIRCFDVVLLVFISGICISYADRYSAYVIKRIKRLVFPTWVLLVILFSSSAIACFILGRENLYSLKTIVRSFLFLQDSIGYIWIVRIYMYIALFSPIIVRVNKFCKSDNLFALIQILTLVTLEVIYLCVRDNRFLFYCYEAVGYSVIATIGYRIKMVKHEATRQTRVLLSVGVINLATCIASSIYWRFLPNTFKYPPRLLFLSYGLAVTSWMYYILFVIERKRGIRRVSAIEYLSKNSFTLYLIHIFVLSAVNLFVDKITIVNPWYIKYLIVLGSSIFVMELYLRMKTMLMKKLGDRNAEN